MITGNSWIEGEDLDPRTYKDLMNNARALAGGVSKVDDNLTDYVEHHLSNMLAGSEPLEPILQYEIVSQYMTCKMNAEGMRYKMDDFLSGADNDSLTAKEKDKFMQLMQDSIGKPFGDNYTWRDVNRARLFFSHEDREKGREFMSLCNKVLGGYDPESKEDAAARTNAFMKKANWLHGADQKTRDQLEQIMHNANMLSPGQHLSKTTTATNIENQFGIYDQDSLPKMSAYCDYMQMKLAASDDMLSDAFEENLSNDEYRDLIKTLDKIRDSDDIVQDSEYFDYLRGKIANNNMSYDDQKLLNYVAKAMNCPQVKITKASGDIKTRAHRDAIKKQIESASTAVEVQNALQSSGVFKNVGINFGDGTASKSVAKAAMRVTDEFPCLIGKLGSLDARFLGPGTNGQCTTMGNGHPISINMAEFTNPMNAQYNLNADIQSNWCPQMDSGVTAAEYVVTHEMGHALDGFISKHLGKSEWDAKLFGKKKDNLYSAELMSRVMTACGYNQHGKRGFDEDDIHASVSRYASTNAREWFAECLSEGLLSSNPRPVAKKFMEELRKDMTQYGIDERNLLV